jgi:hypothetical protein
VAFWDIYYEHCSYFSLGSLARLFRRCGFDVLELSRDYADQYLMLEARPQQGNVRHTLPQEDDLAELRRDVAFFTQQISPQLTAWRQRLQHWQRTGQRVAIWGGGSKGVAFLTTLGVQDEVGYVVDINPYKHGTYMAGTGHEVVGPEFLRDYRPTVVIVMNPIYCEDIRNDLTRLGLTPELLTV